MSRTYTTVSYTHLDVYKRQTVTFAYNKTGLWLYPGADAAGQIHIADIGITKESFLEKEPQMLMPQAEDLTRLPKRKADSNKGTYGKVLVIAGSEEISGAAYFSAKAAYLSGCGLVKVFTPVSYTHLDVYKRQDIHELRSYDLCMDGSTQKTWRTRQQSCLLYTSYNSRVKNSIGKMYLQDIKTYHVQKFLNDLIDSGLAHGTVSNIRFMLSDMFDKAVLSEYIRKNPCIGVEMPKEVKKERRVLTREEQDVYKRQVQK